MFAALRSGQPEAKPDLVYAKTEAGRALLAAARNNLSVRERQILLLCTGERNAAGLEKVFGPTLWPDLQRLMARGLLACMPRESLPAFLAEQQAVRDAAQDAAQATAQQETPNQPRPVAEFEQTLAPVEFADTSSANQSGFENTRSWANDPLQSARVGAAWLLIELGGPEALQLRRDYAGVRKEEDVLAFAARAIALAERKWGVDRALDRASRIGQPLSRDCLSRLLDALEGNAGATLTLALYEQWLSGADCEPASEAP